jgi:hypothetical protein
MACVAQHAPIEGAKNIPFRAGLDHDAFGKQRLFDGVQHITGDQRLAQGRSDVALEGRHARFRRPCRDAQHIQQAKNHDAESLDLPSPIAIHLV